MSCDPEESERICGALTTPSDHEQHNHSLILPDIMASQRPPFGDKPHPEAIWDFMTSRNERFFGLSCHHYYLLISLVLSFARKDLFRDLVTILLPNAKQSNIRCFYRDVVAFANKPPMRVVNNGECAPSCKTVLC